MQLDFLVEIQPKTYLSPFKTNAVSGHLSRQGFESFSEETIEPSKCYRDTELLSFRKTLNG